MAQVSYGTITINDITDITDVFLQYCMVADNVTANNISENSWFVLSSDTTVQNKHYYAFNSLDNQYHIVACIGTENPTSLGWYEDKPYPIWQSGNQIWIREARIKEGIDLPEYGTPYLDTAVNQINNNYINLNNKIKKIWSNSTGSYMASGINNNDVNVNDVSTYGYNSKSTTTGISFNYNAIPLIEMGILDSGNFNGIKLYSPILTGGTISGNRLDATLDSNGLKLLKGGLEAGTKNTTDYIYVWSNDDAINHTLTINNHEASDWRIVAGNRFGVDKAGNLYANNATISGAITIQAGSNVYSKAEADANFDVAGAANDASYSVEIEVSAIDFINNSATLIAHPYYKGIKLTNATTPTLSTITGYSWSIADGTAIPSEIVTNTETLQLPNNSNLQATYVCTISKS